MQGVLRGSSCQLGAEAYKEWWSHICGLCLTLRDEHGHLARLTTNYDAALLSVLFEAQAPHLVHHTGNVCPLRRFRRIDVVQATVPGAQHAAAISLLLGATNIRDHVVDGDGWLRWIPWFPGRLAEGWTMRARRSAAGLAFPTGAVESQTQRQLHVEQLPTRDFDVFSQPTELAVGAAFSHTALLAQQPANVVPLSNIGRMYGRIMYLLDSYQDYRADQRAGTFNALARCYAAGEVYTATRQMLLNAHAALKQNFQQLILPKPALAHTLLLHSLRHHSLALLDRAPPEAIQAEGRKVADKSRSWLERLDCDGCCDCCDCCECCSCCDGECCGCDCGCDC